MTAQKSILLTGGTGMIGRFLVGVLSRAGYRIFVFTRSIPNTHQKEGVFYVHWHPSKNIIDETVVRSVDVIIHLAGAGIADYRWTPQRKKILKQSRIKSLSLIASILRKKGGGACKHFISAGGIGYYGLKNISKPLTETAPPGDDFLSVLCVEWENELKKIKAIGIDTTIFRTGIVLDFKSGALKKILPIFRMGLGAALGSGKQYFAWVSLHDICAMYFYAIEHKMVGVYNAVAPETVTNYYFSKQLAHFLNRPFFMMPIPAIFLKIFLGQRAQLLLTGNNICSKKIRQKGFVFKHPNLKIFLRGIQ